MVDHDVAGQNFEPDQVRVVVVGPDRRDWCALGARQWIGGDEPVGPIDGAGQVGAPQ